MTTVKQAAEKAMNLGKQLQAIIDVGEVLDQIGNLEEAKQEAADLKKKAEADRFDAEVALKELNGEVAETNAYIKRTKAEAVKILADTNVARERILGTAREEKDSTIKASNKVAAEIIKTAEDTVSELTAQSDKLSKENETLEKSLNNLRYEMKVLRERLGN